MLNTLAEIEPPRRGDAEEGEFRKLLATDPQNISSVALRRLISEVARDDVWTGANKYNRFHNRHNR